MTNTHFSPGSEYDYLQLSFSFSRLKGTWSVVSSTVAPHVSCVGATIKEAFDEWYFMYLSGEL